MERNAIHGNLSTAPSYSRSPSPQEIRPRLGIGHDRDHSAICFHDAVNAQRANLQSRFPWRQILSAFRSRLLASHKRFKRIASYCWLRASVPVPGFFSDAARTGAAGFLAGFVAGFVAAALGAGFAAGVLGAAACSPGLAGVAAGSPLRHRFLRSRSCRCRLRRRHSGLLLSRRRFLLCVAAGFVCADNPGAIVARRNPTIMVMLDA